MKKTCSKCDKEKNIEDFVKCKQSKSGRRNSCKTCRYKQRKKIHYLDSNCPNIIICTKCNVLKKKECFSLCKFMCLGRNSICKDCINNHSKNEYYKDLEYSKSRSKEYYLKNRNIIFEKEKERCKNDISFKIKKNVRRRILLAIHRNSKSDRTIKLLGISTNKYRFYLESKFQDGMTWENYGVHGWHIDHIIPCSTFDLSKPKQQKECFHYTNTQPLWAEENLKKGNRIC